MHLGKYDDLYDRSRSLAHVHMIVSIITIAEAIARIEPDPSPVMEITGVVTIAVIVNSDVSI